MHHIIARLTGQEVETTEARNGLRHVLSLSMTKLADGLIDPKLVLSWLLGILGAPAAIIGMLVPIREAGALLPQMLLGRRVQQIRYRRWVWVFGSVGQGISAGLIAVAALTLDGAAAGGVICLLLAALAVSRAACSVSYKDILGKTISQKRRGAVTGLAGSVSALLVLGFAALLLTGVLKSKAAVIGAIVSAGGLWLLAALLFSRIEEKRSTPEAPESAQGYLDILRDDLNLRRFILVRGLLVSTALAPPYMVLLSVSDESATGQLGAMVLASASAAFLSSYVWGRLSDRNSPLVLLFSGGLGAMAMGAAILATLAGIAEKPWIIPVVLCVLMIAHHGVRQSRSTYLVDISDENRRSANTALANTAIGLILLVAGALGGALAWAGPLYALTGFAVMALAGGFLALTLRAVDD
ncbi:Major Facilitator Superfamily protein [Roseovarius litorisediminis]|uniref:Major Facilitator Superfamily protein n=1 Tax=Roseovarius litorisediminis TaxID=1312363 RepID=A0A1Y5T055_9RHOB|nr:MFS transporter [Roseovarius litorisediminis]SLN52800.1 Major Facilitator Superfamily protein [Roseovarius litorisediminis]